METYVIINLTIECSHNICLFVLLLQAPTGAVHTNFDCPVVPWVSCRYLGVTIWIFVCQDVFFFFFARVSSGVNTTYFQIIAMHVAILLLP